MFFLRVAMLMAGPSDLLPIKATLTELVKKGILVIGNNETRP